MDAAVSVYEAQSEIPRWEFALKDQLRRSSRAVPALLAEAWARRAYPAAFREKLSQALGEAMEAEVWLEHAWRSGHLPETVYRSLVKRYDHVGAMLTSMSKKADAFRPTRRA